MHRLEKYIREPVNGLTHSIGAILSVFGLLLLLDSALDHGSLTRLIAFGMFGFSMILLYTASSLYHSLHVKEKTIALLQRFDHSMIYVKIAGTYTPICLLVLEGEIRWVVFTAVWSVALFGILKKVFWPQAPHAISVVLYLVMGWMGVFLFPTLYEKLPLAFMIWIIAGGLSYTIGIIFFGLKRPALITRGIGSHEIWHLFVMAGTFSHFCAIYIYL